MSLDIKKTLSAMGDSLAYAYGAFSGVKENQAENTPPVGSRDQIQKQVANSGGAPAAGIMGLGMLPLIIIAGLFFMLKK